MILVIGVGLICSFTIYLQAKAKAAYGNRVKTYADLGEACYGQWGRAAVAVTLSFSQLLVCTSYVMFVIAQMDEVLFNST